MRFLDKDNEWQDQWPPQSAVTGGATIGFPRAVEVQLELDDVGTLSWLFPLPQNAVATPQPPAGQNTGTEGGETGATGQPAAQGATP
jgi:hypothetical protein